MGASGAVVECPLCKARTGYQYITEYIIDGDLLKTPVTDASIERGRRNAVQAWNMRGRESIPAQTKGEVRKYPGRRGENGG